MNRNHKYGSTSKRKIATGKHELQQVCKEAMRIANERKLHCPDFSILSVLRTAVGQFELYKKGRKQVSENTWLIEDLNQIVTYCDGYNKLSVHQTGLAVDFCAWVDGKSNFDNTNLAVIATCFMQACTNLGFGFEWGGSFKSFVDSGHFEVII